MGNKDRSVKNALQDLCRMAQDNKEKRYLQQHAGDLRSLLEKIDNYLLKKLLRCTYVVTWVVYYIRSSF